MEKRENSTPNPTSYSPPSSANLPPTYTPPDYRPIEKTLKIEIKK